MKNIISNTIKAIAVIASIYGIIITFNGFISFTYFTILSNIFVDFMLGVFLFQNLTGKEHSNSLYKIKFLSTLSICLTCFVYMFILAPTTDGGVLYAYFNHGAGSFCLHLLNPALAIVDFILFDYKYNSKKTDVLLAVIPPYVYVVFVLILHALGVSWYGMAAPYNFLNYEAKVGWFGFDLSQLGATSLGIGVFYMIVILSILFIALGAFFLKLKSIIKAKNESCNSNVNGV